VHPSRATGRASMASMGLQNAQSRGETDGRVVVMVRR
jgi:hypothetical protein